MFPAHSSIVIKHISNTPLLFEWHRHDCYELILTLGAVGKKYIAGAVLEFKEVDLTLICPHVPHTWDSSKYSDTAQDVIVILWPKTLFANRFPEFDSINNWLSIINESHTFFVEKNHPMINALFLLAAAKHPLDKLAKLITLLQDLQNLPSTESGYKNGHQLDPRLTQALSYISENIENVPNLTKTAKQANVSNATLKRLFKTYLGSSFSAQVNLLRLEKSRHLLATTRLSIDHVASLSGFKSACYFNKVFKVHMSVTPTAYRSKNLWRK